MPACATRLSPRPPPVRPKPEACQPLAGGRAKRYHRHDRVVADRSRPSSAKTRYLGVPHVSAVRDGHDHSWLRLCESAADAVPNAGSGTPGSHLRRILADGFVVTFMGFSIACSSPKNRAVSTGSRSCRTTGNLTGICARLGGETLIRVVIPSPKTT